MTNKINKLMIEDFLIQKKLEENYINGLIKIKHSNISIINSENSLSLIKAKANSLYMPQKSMTCVSVTNSHFTLATII